MKRILLFLVALAISSISFAQLTGTKNVPGDYASLDAAIADLNVQGVGSGGVVINLLAGNPETAPAGGYAITTLTGTASNPIVITGNSNIITASAALTAGALNDAIFKIIGSDYVTIQGFTMQENAANTVTTAASNNMTEFGVALFYASVTDGAKNITIQNNTISLVRTYQNTFGIYSNVRHSSTVIATAADITAVTGANDNTKIYGNIISNVNNGIVIVGSTTAAYMNTGIDIGGSSLSTGNTISDYGTTGTFSGYVSVSGSVMGINVNNSLGTNISYNSVTCPGLNTAGTVYGIYSQVSGTLPTTGGPYNSLINHNTLAIKSGVLAGTVYGINNSVGNSVNNFDMSYNDFNNMGHNIASPSGTVYCLYASGGGNTQNITYNTFTNLSLTTTGSVYLMNYNASLPLATSTQTVTNNAIVGTFAKTGAGGTVYCAYTNASSAAGSTKNISYNTFSNITLTGATALTGFQDTDGGTPAKSIHHNTLSNVTGGSSAITGLTFNYGTANIFNNTFSNISGSGAITVMACGGSSATLQNVYSNEISGISTTGAAVALYGIQSLASGTSAVSNVYKNKIYNMTNGGATPSLYGIYISAGTTINTYNNFISDLKTPAANAAIPLAGIYVSGGTTNNVFFNTVFLDGTSTGALFGSAALYASTTPTLDMRNNILINNTTPTGTGIAAAYRRSGTTLTSYSANSNANNLYAGTPSATHLVFYDGTNSDQTMAAFQTRVGPARDAVSFTENTPFVNVATTPYDLHVNTSIASYCESGGLAITTPFAITDDFDGNTRTATPDVGADEFAGIAAGVINPALTASVFSSQQINVGFTMNPAGNPVVIVFNTTGTFTTPAGAPPAVGSSFAGGTLLYFGNTSPVNHTGLTPGTTYYYKAFSYDVAAGIPYSSGVTANATPAVAPPTAFTATPFSSTQINLAYTLNALSNNVIIATNSTSTFGVPANGTAYTAGTALPTAGTVIYVGPLAAFNHTGLSALTTYYYKVWSLDAYNYYSATGATANATTPCGDISTFPYTEGFGSSLGCWSYSEGVTGSTVHWGTATSDATHGVTNAQSGAGTYFARLDVYNAQTSYNPYYFVSPTFVLDATPKQVNYYYWLGTAGYQLTPVPLTLQISTNGGSTWTDLYAHTSANSTFATATTSPWTQNVVSLAAYTGQSVKFRFVSQSNYGSGFCNQGIDTFVINDIPNCPPPTALAASSITSSSAILSWSSTASTFDVDYGTVGHTAGAGTIVAGVTNPYTLGGLSANTSYDYFVRSNCAGSLQSAWAGPFTFTTECSVVADFSENFDGVTAPAIPNCWKKYTSPSFTYETVTTYATSPYSSPNCIQLYSSGAVLATDAPMLISPALTNLSAGSHQLHFFAKGASTNLSVIVGTMSDPANSATFVPFQTVSGLNTSTFTEKVVSFATYAGTDTYIAIAHPLTTTYSYVYLDNISWEVIPACPIPTALTATPGNTFANLGWTPGNSETSWDIEWGASGFTQGTGTTVTGVTNPYTLSGLTPSTAYSYYVRANCGAGSYSAWAGPKTFTTTVACPAPTSLSATNLTKTTVDLGWTEVGTATTWDIEFGAAPYTATGTPTISGVTSNPYNLGGLTAGTTYVFYVRANCGASGTSTWSGPVTFTTVCGEISTFPWTEGFETAIIPSLKACWSMSSGAGYVTTNNSNSTYDADAHTGTQFLREAWSATNEYVWTPAFTLTGGTSYDFSFFWAGDTYSGWTGDVFVNSSPTDVGATQLGGSFVTNATVTTKTYAKVLNSFIPSTSGTYYFAIRVNDPTGDPWYLSFDDFRLEPTPLCTAPTSVTIGSVTTASASISWAGASTVDIDYGAAGHAAGSGTIVSGTSTNPYGISGLSASTSYDVYVRQVCGAGNVSSWYGPVGFTTLCTALTLPYTQNFDAVTAPAIPNCMAVSNDNNDSQFWKTSTSYYRSAPNSMYISYNTSAAMNDWFYTPGFNLAPGQYKVSFWYRNSGTSYPEKLEVKWGTAQSAAAMTLGTIYDNPAITSATYAEGTGTFTVTTAGTYYLGWHGYSDADMWYLVVDDISITEMLAHDVAVNSIDLGSLLNAEEITPKATIINNGTNTETFTVSMTIGSYSDVQTVTALAPGSSVQVAFANWTPAVGTYNANACTNLGSDLLPANDCKTKSITIETLTKFYAYNAYDPTASVPEGPGYFYKEHPNVFVSLAPTTSTNFISAGSWANGIWYGAEYYDNSVTPATGGGWYKIDPSSGAMTLLASMGRGYEGITYDHIANIMYGIDGTNLYSINLADGAGTLIGAITNPGGYEYINLATDGTGFLYTMGAVSTTTQAHLFKINPTAVGGPTVVDLGSTGQIFWYAQDMEYDYESNTMYACGELYSGGGGLYSVNLGTGAFTLVSAFQGGAELTGFAIPYTYNPSKTLTVKAYLEGLFNGVGLNQAYDENGPHWAAGIADKVTLELRNSSTGALVYTVSNADLGTNGIITATIPAAYNGSYYIYISHRNHLTTSTASAVSFSGSTISYDFTTGVGQAFASNMKDMAGTSVIFGGDVNQDMGIDASDMIDVDNDNAAFGVGYIPTDVDGSGGIDATDMIIVDNNNAAFVGVILPF